MKLAVNTAFFGPNRTRYTQFGTERTLEEKLGLVAQVPGLDGVELKFPADFAHPARTAGLLKEHGLTLSAVNVETKDAEHWRHGALSAADPAARSYCIERLCASCACCTGRGRWRISVCHPVIDLNVSAATAKASTAFA